MTIQEAKDRVVGIRQSAFAEMGATVLHKQRMLYKEFIASVAAGTCEDTHKESPKSFGICDFAVIHTWP